MEGVLLMGSAGAVRASSAAGLQNVRRGDTTMKPQLKVLTLAVSDLER
jgi:hypothetical protein